MKTIQFDRSMLDFPNAVKDSFAFLAQQGFRVVEENETLVRYRSERVEVSIFHGRASYELGIEFRLVGASSVAFNLYRVLVWARHAGMLANLPSLAYQTNSKDEIRRMVHEIAVLVTNYGGPILAGDVAFFQNLQEEQSKDAALYTKEVHLRAIRRHAEEAWQSKNYAAVVRIYAGMSDDDMTASETMRFRYAKKSLMKYFSNG